MKTFIYMILLFLQSPESVIICCSLPKNRSKELHYEKSTDAAQETESKCYEASLIKIPFNCGKLQMNYRKEDTEVVIDTISHTLNKCRKCCTYLTQCSLLSGALESENYKTETNATTYRVMIIDGWATKDTMPEMKSCGETLVIFLPIKRRPHICSFNRGVLSSDSIQQILCNHCLFTTRCKSVVYNKFCKESNEKLLDKKQTIIHTATSTGDTNNLLLVIQKLEKTEGDSNQRYVSDACGDFLADRSATSHLPTKALLRHLYFLNRHPMCALPIIFHKQLRRRSQRNQNNIIYFTENCPRKCTCFVKDDENVTIGVDCEEKGLTAAPSLIPFGSKYVSLKKNHIVVFSGANDYWWRNVRHLNLRENQLKEIHERQLPPEVFVLDVAYNKLINLHLSFVNKMKSNSTYRIFMAGNSWKCTCQEYKFVEWFKRSKDVIPDHDEVYCYWFEEAILAETRTKMVSRTLSCNIHRIVAGVTAIILLLVVLPLIVICTLLYCSRQLIYAILNDYNLFPSWLDNSKGYPDDGALYDVFACFHLRDRRIANTIIAALGPRFQFCTQEHAWLPRPNADRDLLFRFLASKVTLLICSRRFVKSAWFQTKFRKIYYDEIRCRLARMIIIRVDDAKKDGDMESLLRKVFPDESILIWGERWFWQKLRFALRHIASRE